MTSAITGKVKPRIEIAPGADPAGDPSLWTWFDAGKRRAKIDIVIGAGRDDEASEVEAGSFGATMDNRDGRLSPRNILGPYYGTIGRGTPLRLILDRTSDSFTRTVSGSWGTNDDGFVWSNSNVAGTYAVNGTQATAALPINNATRAVLVDAGSPDIEVTWSTTLDVLPTGASFVSAALLRHTDANNYIRAHVELQAAGTVAVKVSSLYGGVQTDILGLTATSVTYSAGTKVWGKARADGPYVMVKTWTGLVTDEPDTWQGATIDDSVEGVGAGLLLWRINTNVGTYTAKIDDFELTNILWTGNVPEWSPKWPEKSGTDSTLPLVGAGVIRRLSQGTSPPNSPLLNQLTAQNPFTYFPLEEAGGARQASEAKTGKAATLIDVTFAGDDTLPGASTAAVLNTANVSRFRTTIASSPTPDGYAALWFFKLGSLPGSDTAFVEMSSTGTMTRFTIALGATALSWNGYSDDGTLIANASALYAVDPTQWVAMQLETNVSGGVTTVALIWHQVGSETFYASTDTYSGTSSKPDVCSIWAPTDSMSLGHVWFGDNDLPFVDTTFMLVSDGYRTELASDRIIRLGAEAGVRVYVLAGDSEPMGRQKPNKFVDLFRECEATDQGILCERGNALMYIPRSRRYNAPVDMALDWLLGHLDEAPEPTDDDQRFRNQWTVSRIDGGSVTVVDEDSIAKTATIDDSASLSLADDSRLADFGYWFLNRDTADYLRWPRIKINLIAHPELIPMWLACRIGSRITLANPPVKQLAGEVIDLVIEGYTETLNNYVWTVELACAPAQAWLIGAYDDGVALYDAIASVLSDVAEADVWCPIVVADALGAYSQASVPYNVKIAGQINAVVGMTKLGTVAQVDGTFEAYDNSKWLAFNAAATPPVRTSPGGGHRGQYAVTATANGIDAQFGIRPITAARPSALPLQTFTLTLWAKRSTAGNLTATIDWYNGASYLSSSTTTVAVGADTWTEVTVSGAAPASTTNLTYGPTIGSTPAAGVLLTVDDIDIVRTDVMNLHQIGILTRAVDGFPKALPAGSSFRIAAGLGGRYGL